MSDSGNFNQAVSARDVALGVWFLRERLFVR